MGLVDFNALLFDPVHTVFGEDATLTPQGGEAATVNAIDRTAGVPVGDNLGMETIKPAAVLRMSELTENDVLASDLNGAALSLNGKDWRVEAYRMLPTPKGEADGRVMLFLIED